jgi:hypothetical protein
MNRAENFDRGMMGKGIKTTDFFRVIPLPNIPLPLWLSTTEHAHWKILAHRAETSRLMVEAIFKTRNPCKHWAKPMSAVI